MDRSSPGLPFTYSLDVRCISRDQERSAAQNE